MRVISGKYASRIIKMPKGAKIRPTKDRVREALFGIIAGCVPGAKVLDAFSGSGAFGIEAISRGAARAVFVENDKRCVRAIKENLKALAVEEEKTLVIKADALRALDILAKRGEKFDVVLLDPPYCGGMAKKSLLKLDGHVILTPLCIIVAEHHKNDTLPDKLEFITSYRVACYGDIRLSFYGLKDKRDA